MALTVAGHDTLERLEGARDALAPGRHWRRLQGLVLAKLGRTAAEVAQALSVGERTVHDWVAKYNAEGLSRLAERPRSGRPRLLAPEEESRLADRLDRPVPGDGPGWSGPKVAALIKREFGVLDAPSGLYDLLRRLGYSRLMPRPRHPKADPAAAAAFKKSSAGSSGQSSGGIRASGSRSGSRTRRGSARRGR